jgi:hypothetical protein
MFLTETATNVDRVVAPCATDGGGMWIGLVSDLAQRSHSRRTAHTLVGGEVALPRSGPSVYYTRLRQQAIGMLRPTVPPIACAQKGSGFGAMLTTWSGVNTSNV